MIVAVALPPNAYAPAAISGTCEIGRMALIDLPQIDRSPSAAAVYAMPLTDYPDDILVKCPGLGRTARRSIKMISVAKGAFTRSGMAINPAAVFSVNTPIIDRLHGTAYVTMGYTCAGLCGAWYRANYRRKNGHWVRDGSPMITAVS